jgi:hypothetical protein
MDWIVAQKPSSFSLLPISAFSNSTDQPSAASRIQWQFDLGQRSPDGISRWPQTCFSSSGLLL